MMNLRKLWYKFWLDRKINRFHRQVDRLEQQIAKRGLSVKVKRLQSLVVCVSYGSIEQKNKCVQLLQKLKWQHLCSNNFEDLWKP